MLRLHWKIRSFGFHSCFILTSVSSFTLVNREVSGYGQGMRKIGGIYLYDTRCHIHFFEYIGYRCDVIYFNLRALVCVRKTKSVMGEVMNFVIGIILASLL